eukprot:10019265-Alexandrium_andersonii.AAC.1
MATHRGSLRPHCPRCQSQASATDISRRPTNHAGQEGFHEPEKCSTAALSKHARSVCSRAMGISGK